jgi:hypothetical protein
VRKGRSAVTIDGYRDHVERERSRRSA